MARQQQVGIGLVVPEEDVVLGTQPFDEVVLQQQGFGLGAGDGGLDVPDARHHVADAGRQVRLLEVAGNPLLQVPGLAHVEHRAVLSHHAIHAGQVGQGLEMGCGVEAGGRVVLAHAVRGWGTLFH